MNFIIQIIVGVVLSVASTLLKQAFAKPQAEQRRTGTRGSAQVGGKVGQSFLIGTVGDPGKFEDGGEWGNDGEVPNAYSTDVHSYGDLPITGVSGLFVNGVRHSIPTAGAVAQGYPVAGLSNKFWWKFYDGTQTAADSFLVDKFGGKAERPWTADKIGRGIPYLITTSLWDEALWTGFPQVLGEFQGIKLYDPRKDSTAGGSGSQRWGQPATYAFSDNSMVIIYNIERGIYYEGAHVWGGKKTAGEMPYAAWKAAMDACDLPVALVGGGTEPQFRAGRRIALNERPADVIRELLIGCNGRITHAADGLVWPLVGVPAAVGGAFSDADILATNALGSIPFPNLDEIINGATATYREPSQAWEDKETAPYLRSDLEIEDDGRQQIEGLDLGTTFSGTQAQRILKAVIEEGRRFRTHVVALPPEFAQFRVLQQLAWTSPRFGYVNKRFLITARTVEPFGNVIFGLQEVDPADHNWVPSTDQKPLSFAPVVTNRPAPQAVSGPSAAPVTGELAFDAFWAAASVAVDVDFVRISYRKPGQNAEVVPVPKPTLLTGTARVSVPMSLSGTPIEVQLEYIALSGRPMVASAWMPVTIADVRVGPDDLTDELQTTIDGVNDWLDEGIPALEGRLTAIDGDISAINAEVNANFSTLNTSIGIVQAQVNDVFAADSWVNIKAYPKDDIVQYSGALYRAKQAVPVNTVPTNTTYWEKIGNYTGLGAAVAGTANLLTSEVARIDGVNSSQGTSITALQNALPGKADASAVTALTTRVTSAENVNTSQGTAITGLQNALPGKADASVVSALDSRVTSAENVNTSQGSAITGLTNTINDSATGLATKASNTALNSLTSRVTDAEGTITTQGSAITSLNSTVAGKADATALSSLETKVTQQGDNLVSTSRDTRHLQNALLAAAMLNAEQGQNQILANTDQLAASAFVSETVRTEVSRIDADIGVKTAALASQIEAVQATIEDDFAGRIQATEVKVEAVDDRVDATNAIVSAQGTSVDQLRAVVGNSGAQVLVKGEAVAAPAGISARYAVRLQTTNDSGVVGTATMFADVLPDGTTRWGWAADEIVFFAEDNTPLALIDAASKSLRSSNGAWSVNMITGNMTMTQGSIQSADGKFLISPNLKRISIST